MNDTALVWGGIYSGLWIILLTTMLVIRHYERRDQS